MVFFQKTSLTPFEFTCLAFASSLIAGTVAWLLYRPARRIGFLSRHRRDRFGSGRIPLVGGPALACGMLAPLLVLGMPLRPGAALAAGGFFLIGLLDDVRNLRVAPKFALQAAVAAGASLLLVPSPGYAALGFVLFLLLVNASNYVDNMDALLPGVALTQAVTLLLLRGMPCSGAPLVLWAMPALLLLTLPPARVYLGDSGSHLVGALFAVDALHHLVDDTMARPALLLPLAVLFAVPLADVATVTLSRLRRKRPIFRGGIDHLSHRLVRAGFPAPQAVLVLVLASGVCGVASLLLARFG